MHQAGRYLMLAGGVVVSFFAQQPPRPAPVHAQSTSSVALSAKGDDRTLEINNVSYEVTADFVPGRPRGERLLLRKTTSSKQILGEIGLDSTTTLEAWPLGADPKQKPLYVVKASAVGGQSVDSALFVAERGLEEVSWWSVYRLGTGQHLFDSYVPVISFSISRETLASRYVGLEVPPDDTADARLKKPNVVAVLTYASEAGVKREALLTCDDPRQALLLRSYPDTTRTLSTSEGHPPLSLKLTFESNYPSPPSPVNITIPLTGDDLDLAHAQLPPHLHLTAWKR